MGEIKVETNSLREQTNTISNAASNVIYNPGNITLSKTNINPFKDFEKASSLLSTAIDNYKSIITQDIKTIGLVVDEIEKNDNELGNQISQTSIARNI